jgi:hypothetical protein
VLTWLDWIVVCAPILLGVLGALLSIRPPNRKFQGVLAAVLLLLGAGTAASMLYQIRQSRASDNATQIRNEKDKKDLQDTIKDLRKQVGVLSDTSIPALEGDVKGLKTPKSLPPDLRVRFVHMKDVAIVIENAPHVGIADRPKYGVQLLDFDNLAADYLRIPTNMGDYIRPGDYWGPNQFMGIDAVKGVVKPGDRIFGSVEASCPTCVKTRGYWVYIKVGEGGWYAEQDGEPKAITTLNAARGIADNLDVTLAALVPESKRIPIHER